MKQGSEFDLNDHSISLKPDRSNNTKALVYDEEQRRLRESFLISGRSSSVGDDDVIRIKKKSTAEKQQEEREVQRALDEMKRLGDKSTANEDSFLYDYLAKQRWKDKAVRVHASDDEDLEDDAEELEKVDKFESKYNFRFEEMEAEQAGDLAAFTNVGQIVGHSRTSSESFRRPDDKRKQQREIRKEKKDKEKRQKEEELKRLKNLKRKEVGSIAICSLPNTCKMYAILLIASRSIEQDQ